MRPSRIRFSRSFLSCCSSYVVTRPLHSSELNHPRYNLRDDIRIRTYLLDLPGLPGSFALPSVTADKDEIEEFQDNVYNLSTHLEPRGATSRGQLPQQPPPLFSLSSRMRRDVLATLLKQQAAAERRRIRVTKGRPSSMVVTASAAAAAAAVTTGTGGLSRGGSSISSTRSVSGSSANPRSGSVTSMRSASPGTCTVPPAG